MEGSQPETRKGVRVLGMLVFIIGTLLGKKQDQ